MNWACSQVAQAVDRLVERFGPELPVDSAASCSPSTAVSLIGVADAHVAVLAISWLCCAPFQYSCKEMPLDTPLNGVSVLVAGGGLAGLSAAYDLMNVGAQVTVVE